MTEQTSNDENAVEEEPVAKSKVGSIGWCDLTIDDAHYVSEFYCSVVGWESQEVPMGSYADFNICKPNSQEVVAGICHARGSNQNLPPQWLMYVNVESVAKSAEICKKRGGKVLDGPRRMSGQNFCVIQDPAGAVLALMSEN